MTHSTNYFNTFIEIAEDCPIPEGIVPPMKGNKKTLAVLQYEMIANNPYQYTSDDVLFQCFASRREIPENAYSHARDEYFSKGQACLRASPLTKKYGWGVHCNHEGRIALYSAGTPEYLAFVSDQTLKRVKAMRSSKR